MPEKLLRLPDVQELYPMSRAHIYAEIARGRFPKPVPIGVRAVAWRASDIEALIESKGKQAEPQFSPAA
jgi:prophage regulatory protein